MIQKQHLILLRDLTKREFKTRYLGSIIGSYWNVIHPLVMILIYTMVFSRIMHTRLGENAGPFSYSIYLCSGLFAWNFLSEIMNRGTATLLDNASFLKKLSLPPWVLFGANIGTAWINFIISFSIFILFYIWVESFHLELFLIYFFIMILLSIFAGGMALTLGCLNVFIRDVQQMVSVIFQLWFWFTPIVYLKDSLPDLALKLLYFNPAFSFLDSFHELIYFQRVPPAFNFYLMLIWSSLSFLMGSFIYKKTILRVRDQL